MKNLFSGTNTDELVSCVRERLNALHNDIEITQRVIKLCVKDVVREQCPHLKFLEVLQKVDEIYLGEEWKDVR